MKKMFATMLILVLLVSLLAVGASAAWITENIRVNFTREYIKPVENGAMTLRYNPENIWFWVRASTDVSVSADMTGYAYVKIWALNNETSISTNSTRSNGIINSGKAVVNGQYYAKEVNHYGYRTFNGQTTHWDYYCE